MAVTDSSIVADRDEWWSAVIGQHRAVSQLRASVPSPVHAYLFVGHAGAGPRAASAAFAAALLATDAARRGADPERAASLALAEQHPDLHVFEPEGARLSADEARGIVGLASRSPVEGSRKVIVLTEFHRTEMFAAILLKAIEEPPPSTVFVILADEVVPDLVTIASRALRIDFGPVPAEAMVGALVADGVEESVAVSAADASGGDLRRARLLATDPSLNVRRDSWRSVPNRVDGTGHTATMLVDEVIAHIDGAQEPLDRRHATERADLAERVEAYGLRGSGSKQLEDRHKREVRRHRTDELRYGLATLAGAYRDRLAGPDPDPAIAALDRIQSAAEALQRNPNETLLLQALFANLPA